MHKNGHAISCRHARYDVVVVVGGDCQVPGGGAGLSVTVNAGDDGGGAVQGSQVVADAEVPGGDPGVAGLVVERVTDSGDDDPGAGCPACTGGDGQPGELLVLVTLDDREDWLAGRLAGGGVGGLDIVAGLKLINALGRAIGKRNLRAAVEAVRGRRTASGRCRRPRSQSCRWMP